MEEVHRAERTALLLLLGELADDLARLVDDARLQRPVSDAAPHDRLHSTLTHGLPLLSVLPRQPYQKYVDGREKIRPNKQLLNLSLERLLHNIKQYYMIAYLKFNFLLKPK